MLVAPLVLAAVSGAAFGGFGGSGDGVPLQHIPVILVNKDNGTLGETFGRALQSAALADLLAVQVMDDLSTARALAARGEVRAAVYVPPAFSTAVQTPETEAATIVLYTDPTASISSLIVRAVVAQIANQFNSATIGSRLVVETAAARAGSGALTQLPAVLADVVAANTAQGPDGAGLTTTIAGSTTSRGANPLAYFAPSMAVLFLMFTLFDAASSILEEAREGTLARLLTTPTGLAPVLLGKMAGVFLTGVLQLGVLILASALLFGLDWGRSAAGLLLMVIAVVAAAASLGALIVAVARDERQASIVGSAIALIFAILGGNFVESQAYPAWMQPLSHLTINRWALDGLTDLSLRGLGLAAVWPKALVLLAAAALFFGLALWRLPRRFVR